MFLWQVCTPNRLQLITTQSTTIWNFMDHIQMCILWPACMQALLNEIGKDMFELYANKIHFVGSIRIKMRLFPRILLWVPISDITDIRCEVPEIKLRLVKTDRRDMPITTNVHFMNRSYKIRVIMVASLPLWEFLESFAFSYNLFHRQIKFTLKSSTQKKRKCHSFCSLFYDRSVASFILQSVLRQVRSLFQSEFSIACNLVLPLSISSIFSFP
jgi:hypothetical protein